MFLPSTISIRAALSAALWTAVSVQAQAPLTIDGVADRTSYNNQVSLRVPSTTGYSYQVRLDGSPIPTDVFVAVNRMDYHELSVSRTNASTSAVTNRLVRFIVLSSNRGSPERGLIEWTPYPPIPSTSEELAGARLHLMMPEQYPAGLEIPVAVRMEASPGGPTRRVNGWVMNGGVTAPDFRLLRGVGHGFLPASAPGSIAYTASVQNLDTNKTVTIEPSTVWTAVSGVLAGPTVWPDNSRIHVTGHLTIPAGATLTIGAGTVVRLNPGVNLTNSGRTVINGVIENPVVFTATNRVAPEAHTGAWGGWLLRGASAELIATAAIMTGSGAASSFSFSPGSSHRSEQALLLIHSGATVRMTNCALINQAGQIGNGYQSSIVWDHCLIQRAITCGEYEGCNTLINHSAVIEFPSVDDVYNAAIADADYDGFYTILGTNYFAHSLFGFAKDDAIDSGSGGTGTVVVTNCWVESALHEALAWSGEGRQTWTYDSVLMNNGQGIECGWSTSANSPLVYATRLLSTANSVGARYGDNYEGTSGLGLKTGFLTLTNSLFLHNHRDVWGRVWDDTWNYRSNRMDIRSNFLSQPNGFHPSNTVWNSAQNAARLSAFMSTPPDAPVGLGLAIWTNQFPMASLFLGVPVRLSSFTTNPVSVGYTFSSPGGSLAGGLLTFAPGETVKRIYPANFDASLHSEIRLGLHTPSGSALTGNTNATYLGSVPAPQISLSATTALLPGYRLPEGMFVTLNSPSADDVTLDYLFASGGAVLAGGTLSFNPLETSKQLFLTGVNPFDFALITLSVSNATGATLTGLTSVTYSNAVVTVALGLPSSQVPLDSFTNGVPIVLSGPAPTGVGVSFSIETKDGILTNGVVAFAAGETLRRVFAPPLNLAQHDIIRASLSDPVDVVFGSLTNAYYVRTVTASPLPNVTLIPRGARWRWRALASDAGPTWKDLSYDDSGWGEGPAQLGFGDGDENTPITDNNQITSYFRHRFNVADVTAFTNLSLWLLRDDGGVVHLNGTEIFRSTNMPAPPAAILYSTLAANPTAENNIDIAMTNRNALVNNTNILAVEIHQQDPGSSDVSFNFELIGLSGPPPPEPQPLYSATIGGQWVLAWGDPTFRLEYAAQLDGMNTVWMPMPGPSPMVITPDLTVPQRFYRLRSP